MVPAVGMFLIVENLVAITGGKGLGGRQQGILPKPAESQIRLGASDHLTIGEIVMIAEVFQLQHHNR
jgi:hypothetical protein